MTEAIDPKIFWEEKILGWEDSRYGDRSRGWMEKIAGRASSSLRFRIRAAVALLAPSIAGRDVVELGCGSGLLAEQLMDLGARGYRGIDISEKAIARARERVAASRHAEAIRFEAGPVSGLPPLGAAVIFSLGLFDWLTPAEIDHVFRAGCEGHYFHAIAERRRSLQQMIHRLYVHLSYGHRCAGYVPQYHTVGEIAAVASRHGLPAPNIYRDDRMSFGIFVTDLPLPAKRWE